MTFAQMRGWLAQYLEGCCVHGPGGQWPLAPRPSSCWGKVCSRDPLVMASLSFCLQSPSAPSAGSRKVSVLPLVGTTGLPGGRRR